MTHRAIEIVDAAASLLSIVVVPGGSKVFKHRRESLDQQQDELPAFSVDAGEDQPSDVSPLRGINSALNLSFTAVVRSPTEQEVREKLFAMREQSDALMDRHMHDEHPRLGLPFVYGIGYGGATAPEINPEGEAFVGSLTSNWTVGYRMR